MKCSKENKRSGVHGYIPHLFTYVISCMILGAMCRPLLFICTKKNKLKKISVCIYKYYIALCWDTVETSNVLKRLRLQIKSPSERFAFSLPHCSVTPFAVVTVCVYTAEAAFFIAVKLCLCSDVSNWGLESRG